MKSKGFVNILESIFASPVILFIVLVAVFVFAFGGLGFINGITSMFGIDLLSGAIAGIARPIALMLGFFLFYLLGTGLAKGVTGKSYKINAVPLVFLLMIAVFFFSYSVSGKLIPFAVAGQVQEPPFQSVDFVETLVGSVLGGLIVLFITKRR